MTNDHSRRGFLAAAGAGAAGVAGAAVLGAAGSADAAPPKGATPVPEGANEPLVAYVRDARTGEVAVLVGDREVVVHDRELAARIAQAAQGGQ